MIYTNEMNWSTILIGIGCAIAVILLTILLVVFLLKKKKTPKIKVNTEFISRIVLALGGRKNILSAKTINGRIHFEVEDLDIVLLDELKSLSTAGVFITNQTIKMLFSYDSQTICKTVLALPMEA